MYLSAWATVTNYHRLDETADIYFSQIQKLRSPISRCQPIQFMVYHELFLSQASYSSLFLASRRLSSHYVLISQRKGAGRGRERENALVSLPLLRRTLTFLEMSSSESSCCLQAPPPNTTTLGLGLQQMNLGELQTFSP